MSDSRHNFLAETPVWKLLIQLSAPATVGMIVGALYNIVDTIFVGRFVGTDAISALTVVFPFQLFVMAVAQAIGMGGASIISRSLGARDEDTGEKALGNILTLVFFSGAFFILLAAIFMQPMLRLFGAQKEFIGLSTDYLRIVLPGNFLFIFTVALNNVIRAEGNARIAMFTMMVGAGLNMLLDPLFIYTFNMGIKGAAWATLAGQISGFIFVFWFFLSKKSILHIRVSKLRLEKPIVRETLAMGAGAFVRQFAGSILAVIINNLIAIHGSSVYIAAFGIIHRLLSLLFMPLFGISQGLAPIVGYSYGAKNYPRARQAVMLAVKWSTYISVAGFVIIMLFPHALMSVFSKDAELIERGAAVMRITCLAFPLLGVQIVGSVLFMATGKALPSFILSIARQILFLLPMVLILSSVMGLKGIWYSFPLSDLLAFAITVYMMLRELNTFKETEHP